MSDTQIPREELSPEQVEALNQFDDMRATLGKTFRKMREACQASLKACEGVHKFVSGKAEEIRSLQAELAKQAASPEKEYAGDTLTIAQRMFEGNQRMLEVQMQYDKRNLALAEQGLEMMQAAADDPNVWVRLHESGQLTETYKFALPLEDPAYLEARAQMNLYFGLHHWVACVDGIDGILRATVKDTAVVAQDAGEEEGRAKIAQVIGEAMAGNRDLAVLMGQLGSELQETWAYFMWASQTLKGLAGVPAEHKREALLDADWKKLNGKAVLLGSLIQKVQPYPEVAQFFPEPQAPEVPFDQLEWQEAPVAPGSRPLGTGRLSTGRLPGTGQLKK